MNTFDDKLFEVVKDVEEVKNQINEITNGNSTNNCGMNWIHVEYEYKKGGGTGATTGIAIAKLENDDKVYKFDVLVREKELENDSEEVVISGFTYNSEVYLPYVNRVKKSASPLVLEKRDGLLGIVRDYPLYDGIMIVEGRTTITQEEAVGLEIKNTGESISLENNKDEYNQVLSRVSELETSVSALEEVKHDVVNAHPVGSIVWVTTDEEPNLGGVWEKVTGLTETTIFAYKRTA